MLIKKMKLLSTSVLASTVMLLVTPVAHSAGAQPPAPEFVSSVASSGGVGVASLSAVVDADGTLNRGSGVKSVSLLSIGQGEYEVIFRRNVRNCVYTASVGLSGSSGSAGPGFISVVGRNSDIKGVFISTYDAAGAPFDQGFHLNVKCYK